MATERAKVLKRMGSPLRQVISVKTNIVVQWPQDLQQKPRHTRPTVEMQVRVMVGFLLSVQLNAQHPAAGAIKNLRFGLQSWV